MYSSREGFSQLAWVLPRCGCGVEGVDIVGTFRRVNVSPPMSKWHFQVTVTVTVTSVIRIVAMTMRIDQCRPPVPKPMPLSVNAMLPPELLSMNQCHDCQVVRVGVNANSNQYKLPIANESMSRYYY